MAQPSKRYSLRVLKAKNENNNWSFVPGSDSTIADAAVKVVGRDAASSCSTKEFTSTANSTDDDDSNEKSYQLMALLTRPDAGTFPQSYMRCACTDDHRFHQDQQ